MVSTLYYSYRRVDEGLPSVPQPLLSSAPKGASKTAIKCSPSPALENSSFTCVDHAQKSGVSRKHYQTRTPCVCQGRLFRSMTVSQSIKILPHCVAFSNNRKGNWSFSIYDFHISTEIILILF